MEDAKIVQMYWDRNPEAISVTAQKYGSYCSSIAINILGNNEDAEECVNDTYLNAWNAMPPHKPGILATFLGKITRNLAFNRYKYNRAKKRGDGEVTIVLGELSECVSGKNNVEEEMEYKELVKAINTFVETLTPVKRSIFVCRYWYTDSVSDIAARLGMREGTVSMMLNRLRVKLHKYLSERGFQP